VIERYFLSNNFYKKEIQGTMSNIKDMDLLDGAEEVRIVE
jgi:hypothetical protein